MVVTGVGLVEPETHLQAVDGGFEQRQHHVGPSAAGGVHIHRTATATAMVIAGMGVGVVGTVVGILIPARWQRVCRRGREGLKVFSERHCRGQAGGSQLHSGVEITATAHRTHTELIVCGRYKAGERVAVVRCSGLRCRPAATIHTVFHIPTGLVVAGSPLKGHLITTHVSDRHNRCGTVGNGHALAFVEVDGCTVAIRAARVTRVVVRQRILGIVLITIARLVAGRFIVARQS